MTQEIENWQQIHPDFVEEHHEKTYQVWWKEIDLTKSDAQKWLVLGLSVNDYKFIDWLKHEKKLSPLEFSKFNILKQEELREECNNFSVFCDNCGADDLPYQNVYFSSRKRELDFCSENCYSQWNNNVQKRLGEINKIIDDEQLIIEEKIHKLTDKLADLEREDDEVHELAIVEPNRSNGKEYLDIIARIFTGNETCVATFFDGRELFIASNRKKPKHAKFYLKFLRRFLNNPNDRDSYNKLIELAFREIKFKVKEIPLEKINELKIKHGEKMIIVVLNRIEMYCRKFKLEKKVNDSEKTYDEKELRGIEKLFKKHLANINSIEESKILWYCLSPLHDLNILINAINDKKINKEIIEAIKLSRVKYITGSYNTHAEMKMIGKIFKDEKKGYIGLTKLACAPCWMTIDLLNDQKKIPENCFTVCGTHGGTYLNWKVPKIDYTYKLRLFEKLRDLLIANEITVYKKSYESTKDRFSHEFYQLIYNDFQISKNLPQLKWDEEELDEIKLKTRIKKSLKGLEKREEKNNLEVALMRQDSKEKKKEMTIRREEKRQEAQVEFASKNPNF